MQKTNLIATAILAFGLGGFAGVTLTNDSKMKLEVAMIEEMERFIDDMEWDLQEGIVDTNYAEYYINWFSSLKYQLEYKPEEERYYYE
jgi:hypothetical protein